MDTKPELIRLDPVDPNAISGTNMYIKNEILYHVGSPTHQIKKEEPKVYYDENNHTTLHLANTKTAYIPDTVQSFPASKPMSQYPKYQTPKLRAKSTYSPMKASVAQPSGMYLKPEAELMMGANHHIMSDRTSEHNTVQVITPNANYTPQQWGSDITMTPIMEQTIAPEIVGGQNIIPEAIFIPETSNVINTDTGDYGVINASAINFIPVMTPNGIMLVAANNATSTAPVLSGVTPSASNEVVNQPTAAPSKAYNRRKPTKRNNTASQVVPPEITGSVPQSNVIYSPHCPVLILNDPQTQQTPYKEEIVEIPQKGTVIVEEPPKVIYQPRQFTGSDINENNSTQYHSKKGRNVNPRATSSMAQFDPELDLDAALTVFKIYK